MSAKITRKKLKQIIAEELSEISQDVLNPITRISQPGEFYKRGEMSLRNYDAFLVSVEDVAGTPLHNMLNSALKSFINKENFPNRVKLQAMDQSIRGTTVTANSARDAAEIHKIINDVIQDVNVLGRKYKLGTISPKNVVIRASASEDLATGSTLSAKELEKRAELEGGVTGIEKAETGKFKGLEEEDVQLAEMLRKYLKSTKKR